MKLVDIIINRYITTLNKGKKGKMPLQVSAEGFELRSPLRGHEEAPFLDVPYRKVQASSIPQRNSQRGD